MAYKAVSSVLAPLASAVGMTASSSQLYEWDDSKSKSLDNESSYNKFWDIVKASANN
jgi:hypothetical protein